MKTPENPTKTDSDTSAPSYYTIEDTNLANAFPTFAPHPKHLDNFGWPIYVCRHFAAWYHQKNELTPTDQPQNNDAYITVDRTNPDSPVITIHHYHKLHNNIFKKQCEQLNNKKWKQDLQRTYNKTVGYPIPTTIAFESDPVKKKIIYLGDKANQSYPTWRQPVTAEHNYYQRQRKHRWKNRFGKAITLLAWLAVTALLFTLIPAFSIKPAIDIGLKIFTVFAAGITLSWLGIEAIPDTLEWIETRWNKNKGSVTQNNSAARNNNSQLTVRELVSYIPTGNADNAQSWAWVKTHLPLLYYLAMADEPSRIQYRQWAKKNWPTLLLKGIIWGTVIGLSILSIVLALSAPPTALVPLATFFASHYHMTLSAFFVSIAALVGSLYYTSRHYLTSDSETFQKGAYATETIDESRITTDQKNNIGQEAQLQIEEINKRLNQQQTTKPTKARTRSQSLVELSTDTTDSETLQKGAYATETIDEPPITTDQENNIGLKAQLQDEINKLNSNIEKINKRLNQRQTTTPTKARTRPQSLVKLSTDTTPKSPRSNRQRSSSFHGCEPTNQSNHSADSTSKSFDDTHGFFAESLAKKTIKEAIKISTSRRTEADATKK